MKILKTDCLSIGYRSKKSVKQLASCLKLHLDTGKLTCLIGRNGIGKSTLLRTLSGLQKPLDGTVFIHENEMRQLDHSKRAQSISIVLTERIPTGNLSVWELIAMGRQPYTNWIGLLTEKDKVIIENAIKQTGVADISDQKCDTLSDGQMQRVMIARALAQDTPLIILDEPTAHLDIQHKVEIFRLLKKLAHDSGKSILVSTHEIHFSLEMADVLWILTEKGVQSGSPEDLIQSKAVNRIFENDIVHFDSEKRRFSIR